MANHSIWTSDAQVKGVISEQTANTIKNCALLIHDLSGRRRKLLGLRRLPPATSGANNATQRPTKR
jgi:hypothetical protein